MPTPKGRGMVVRYRTIKRGGKTLTCEIVEKEGPRGGHTVCHPRRRPKKTTRKRAR